MYELLWNRNKIKFQSNLNQAHVGFLPGSGSTNGQLLAQEILTDAKEEGQALILRALDGSKAFDCVSNTINHVKTFKHGINDNHMLMIQEQYRNQSKVIRWEGRDSSPITTQQGLSQGAHNSPPAYLIHNNSNLNALDNHSTGYHIGSIKLTNVTVADDELLVSSSPNDAQLQLHIIASENSRDRAIVNCEKTEAMTVYLPKLELAYNNDTVPFGDTVKHLGLNLSASCISAEAAISKSCKTIYALMGTGVHGTNGLNPIVSRKNWERFKIS